MSSTNLAAQKMYEGSVPYPNLSEHLEYGAVKLETPITLHQLALMNESYNRDRPNRNEHDAPNLDRYCPVLGSRGGDLFLAPNLDVLTTTLEESGQDEAGFLDSNLEEKSRSRKDSLNRKHLQIKRPHFQTRLQISLPRFNASRDDAWVSRELRKEVETESQEYLKVLSGEKKMWVLRKPERPSQNTLRTENNEDADRRNNLKGKVTKEDEDCHSSDPWNSFDLKNSSSVFWKDLNTKEKLKRVLVDWICRFVGLLTFLYLFICSLGILSDSFRLLGGKAAGEVFSSNTLLNNPVSGLMIGLLVTVLLQSSSTTSSIVVAMVASDIIQVQPAIPIIMGANIGTSVTNTLVSLAQSPNRNEFRRAFAGAVIHDVFNWLAVLILLPLETITHCLYHATDVIIESLDLRGDGTVYNREVLKKLTKPFTKLIIQLDTKLITSIAMGDKTYESKSLVKYWCDGGREIESESEVGMYGNLTIVSENATNAVTALLHSQPCNFLFHDTGLSDSNIGIILLVLALTVLCVCLVCIVKLLNAMLRGQVAVVLKKTINADFPGHFHFLTGYFAILVGAFMTLLVQSSSILTSALTPLVGIGVVSLERTFPLTLGANIGTTFTAILAALASESSKIGLSLQIALCHLLFNIFGIIIWYVFPPMRKVPIRIAKRLGNTTAKYRWFAPCYLMIGFFILPATIFGLSTAGWQILIITGGPFAVLFVFIGIVNILQNRAPQVLPYRLKDWGWTPEFVRSLEPFDRLLQRLRDFIFVRCALSSLINRVNETPLETQV